MNEKWTKQSDGSYTWCEFTIRKSEGHSYPWRLFHPTLIDPDMGWGNRFSTLRDATTVAPQILAHHEQKILAEKKAKAGEICRKCRIADAREWSPSLGIGYMDYLALKVGTTAEEVRRESHKAEALELVWKALEEHPHWDEYVIIDELCDTYSDYCQRVPNDNLVFKSGDIVAIAEVFDHGYRVKIVDGYTCHASNEVYKAKCAYQAVADALNDLHVDLRMELLGNERLEFVNEANRYVLRGQTDEDDPDRGREFELEVAPRRTAEQTARIKAAIERMSKPPRDKVPA
jgi:hypothetical protein